MNTKLDTLSSRFDAKIGNWIKLDGFEMNEESVAYIKAFLMEEVAQAHAEGFSRGQILGEANAGADTLVRVRTSVAQLKKRGNLGTPGTNYNAALSDLLTSLKQLEDRSMDV